MTRPTATLRSDYPHFTTISTRWMDNDVYRHLNNVVYYSFFDTAVNEYLLHKGMLDLHGAAVVYLVVETGCQYFRAIAFPDVVHCGLRVARLGNSSVRYEIGIFRNAETSAAAQGHFVHVACERDTHRPLPIPAEQRRMLQALQVPATPAK